MSALSVQPTFPIFTDIDGQPLDNGYIWIGIANTAPIGNPINVYWDAALTIPAVQPIRTIGGYPANNGTPARLYVNSDYSIQVQNKNGSVLYSAPAATERIASSLITYTPGPNSLLTATTVQGALDQLSDDEDGSSYVGFLQAGTNAVPTTVQAKLRETVSVKDFGADQAAIQSAVTKLNADGGGRLLFGNIAYAIQTVPSQTLFEFQNCDGLELDFTGASFTDSTVYTSGTATGYIFKFTNCNGVKFIGELQGTANAYTGSSDQHGATWCFVTGNSNGFDGDFNVIGGRGALDVFDSSATAVGARPRNISAQINTVNCSYPYLSGFGGDNADIKILCDNALRDFFVYGSINVKLDVISKNERATSLLKAYEGQGVDNVFVRYYNRNTTTSFAAAPVIAIEYGDITAAAHRNIEIVLDTKVNAASPWNGTVAFGKYDNSGAADTTGRGHVFENIKITGVSDNTGAAVSHVYRQGGALATSGTPDAARNIIVEDFTGIGTTANIQPGIFYQDVLQGNVVWKNVICAGNMNPGTNPSTSMITLVGCSAQSLTTSASDAGYHTYVNCAITNGGLQNWETNKQFVNCTFLGQKVGVSSSPGIGVCLDQKRISADLTPTTNIFKVKLISGTLATFRLQYVLSSDTGGTNITTGVKTFTASLSSTGVWTSLIAVADDVTERTRGTASVLTVSLVNGDSTGAFVAVAATNYNTSSARASYVLEAVSRFAPVTVAAV